MSNRLPVVAMKHADAQMVYDALLTEHPMFGGFFTDSTRVFGHLSTYNMTQIAFQVIDVELIEGVVYVAYKILGTPMGGLLTDLLAQGMSLGLTPRGHIDTRDNELVINGLNIALVGESQ